MSDVNYWRNIAKEYENVLQIKNEKIEELRAENLYLKHNKYNWELISNLIRALECDTHLKIVLYLSNRENILVSNKHIHINDENNEILKVYKKDDNYEIIYNIKYEDIIGFKTIKNVMVL